MIKAKAKADRAAARQAAAQAAASSSSAVPPEGASTLAGDESQAQTSSEAMAIDVQAVQEADDALPQLPKEVVTLDRTDLLRSLIIGPENTPYEDAPFVIDWMLDANFPQSPPIAHFLSWTNGNGRGALTCLLGRL